MALEAEATDTLGSGGAGSLGVHSTHKERELGRQGQAGAGVRGGDTARLPLRTPAPEATTTKPADTVGEPMSKF